MLEQSLKFCEKAKKLVDGNLAVKIAEVGKPIAEKCYAQADGQDEDHEYLIWVEPQANGASLIALGDDVVFREFGAGAKTSNNPFTHAEGLPPIYPGSWSESEGTGEFAHSKEGYWHHHKQRYYGLTPTLGMYNASRVMRDFVAQYVKEVMK